MLSKNLATSANAVNAFAARLCFFEWLQTIGKGKVEWKKRRTGKRRMKSKKE
jgi:hypothetical protein